MIATGVPNERDVDLFGLQRGKLELWRHHADDRVGFLVQPESAAQDVGASAEALLPQTIANQGNVRRALFGLLRLEGAPQGGRRSQQLKESRGRLNCARHLGFTIARHDHSPSRKCCQGLKVIRLSSPVFKVRIRCDILGYASRCICGPDHDETTGFWIWERVEQDSVNDAKDGRISADAERERYHSYGRESRTLSKRTEAEPDVAPERLQQWNASAIPVYLLSGFDPS